MSITLSDGVNSAEIANPEYGYVAEVSMPITYQGVSGAAYGVHDASDTYDIRFCRGMAFKLDATDMDELADLLRDIDKGRGVDLTLSLGATASGIFPFGPDLGDIGDFTVRVTRFNPGGQLHSPWLYWGPTIDMALVSAPAYSITDDFDDGPVQIGTVTGIRYPQSGYMVDVNYMLQNTIDQSSTGRAIDTGSVADTYENEATFSGNAGKMGALVNYLVATGRGTNITYVAPANNYAFGRDKASSGSHTVQCLYSEREENRAKMLITHYGFDQFSMPLRMRFIS